MLEDSGLLIQVSTAGGDRFRVSAKAPDEEAVLWSFRLSASSGRRDPHDFVEAVFADAPVESLRSVLNEHLWYAILLDIRPRRLHDKPWEAIVRLPPLTEGWDPSMAPRLLVRYARDLADLALVPLSMPIDVLVAELDPWLVPKVDPLSRPLRHFRAVSAHHLDRSSLQSMLGSRSYDIVHIRARPFWYGDQWVLGEEAMPDELGRWGPTMGEPRVAVTVSELRRLLRRTACRLLILETESHTVSTATRIAHDVRRRTGPAVIVSSSRCFDFRQFYYDISHDRLLHDAFQYAVRGGAIPGNAALVMSGGQEEILSLSRTEQALKAAIARQEERVAGIKDAIEEQLADLSEKEAIGAEDVELQLFDQLDAVSSAGAAVREAEERIQGFMHESEGMEPMTETFAKLEAAATRLDAAEATSGRVVNMWFEKYSQEVLASDQSLEAGGQYQLHVNIGRRLGRSNVREPVAVPDDELRQAFEDVESIPIRVVLRSNAFTAEARERTLYLPRPPNSSAPVVFDVVAPQTLGETWLRVGVYYQNNLLQSLHVSVTITEGESPGHARGNVAEVEWVLSGSLRNLELYRPKAINILSNETPEGTHVLSVTGTGFSADFTMGETQLFGLLRDARSALQWVSGDPSGGERYKFGDDNRGSPESFREQLASMAELGWGIYTAVFGKDDDFEKELRQALQRPATIQGTGVKSARYVFPLSLVYDHPLVDDPDNQLCPHIMSALSQGASVNDLARHRCFVDICAFRGDTSIVCPSGFWGFRHIIEQPLSTVLDNGDLRGTTTTDAVTTIPVLDRARLLMGYSEDLEQYEQHRKEVSGLSRADPDTRSRLADIGRGLQRSDLHFVYFYCHGGRHGTKTYLGVGSGRTERLFPENLKAWEVGWPTTHPLVFINGCNTVAITPEDLLTFNERFAVSKAAGVIGSEISIHETLGRYFGNRFMHEFLDGVSVGELLRSIRLELLTRYNPLGLAYTAYCLADLRIVAEPSREQSSV